MTDLAQIEKALAAHGEKVEGKLAEFENSLRDSGDVSAKVKADLKALADDYAGMHKDLQALTDELTALNQKGTQLASQQAAAESMGKQFANSDALERFKAGESTKASMTFQANTITGETGGNPTDDIVPKQNMPGIVGGAFRALRFLDVVPRGEAIGNQVHYTRELLWTNNAAETAEAAQKPESVLTFEPQDVPVRTIPHLIKASKQVLDDAPQLMTYIDVRMRHGVRQRAEAQLINGDGTGQNISGILASGNFTPVVPVASENLFDYANRLKTQVITSDYVPDVFLVNPADWGAVERAKATDGQYLAANGIVGYLQNGLVPTLWGLPVLPSNNVPAGQMICASLDALMFWERQAVTVEIFDQNENDVETNLMTIRAEMRGAFTVFRPAAVAAGTILAP